MSDQEMTNAELRERISSLERDNAALRERVTAGAPAVTDETQPLRQGGRGWGWSVLATVLIVVAVLLAPLAVAARWANTSLLDTDAFVATYAPLAQDASVQDVVTSQVMGVINQHVNADQITSDLIDGLTGVVTAPRAAQALAALKGPAADGLRAGIQNVVSALVRSDAFADTWAKALRVSHSQLLATLNNEPGAAITAQDNGTIGVQLGPIIEDVKANLVSRGFTVAANLPAISKTIVIARSDQVPMIQNAYRLVVAAGTWLPWVVLALFVGGVLAARRRAVTLIWAAAGLGLAMLLMLVAVNVGRAVVVASVPASQIPSNTVRILFDTTADPMRDIATAVFVLAVVVAVVAWFAGPLTTPTRLRGFYMSGVANLRTRAEASDVTTGSFGEWVHSQRVLVRAAIAVIAALVVILMRPLTPGLILWTLAIAVLALVAETLVERPQASERSPAALATG